MTVLCDNCSPRKQCTADKNRTECKYYQPQTNEEWFCQLPTEEKAKVFANATYSSAMMWAEIIALPKEDEVRKWVMWLKQPHRGE